MKLLLDTHLLLWAAGTPERLSTATRSRLLDEGNDLYFSAVSIWEIVIKRALGRHDLQVDPARFRRMLVASGYGEVAVTAEHALIVEHLPALHKDPFDRILIAQARSEGMQLLTVDDQVLAYGDGVVVA